jgi:pimeloyl-ACP methyl ester carboxylesterase
MVKNNRLASTVIADRNLFRITVTVCLACLYASSANAQNQDPSIIIPSTAEFQGCFSSAWKHPWDFPKDNPLYYEENSSMNLYGKKVIEGKELGGGPGLVASYQSLPPSQKSLVLESYKIQFSKTKEEEVIDLLNKMDEIFGNTNLSFTTFMTYTGPELKEGQILMGLIPMDTATVTVGIIDEKYFAKYRDDLIAFNFNYDEAKRNEIQSKLTDMSVALAREYGENITDIPTQTVKIDKKKYGEISYCEQLITNGMPAETKTCSLLNGNIQVTLKLESHSAKEQWTDANIDCLLKLLDEKTRHTGAGIVFNPGNITSIPKSPFKYSVMVDWTLESRGLEQYAGNIYNNLAELVDKEGTFVEAKFHSKDLPEREITTGDIPLDRLNLVDGSPFATYASGVITINFYHETLDQFEAAIDEFNEKNYDYKTIGEGEPYRKNEMSFTVELTIKDSRRDTIVTANSASSNSALTYRVRKPIIFIPGVGGSVLNGPDGTEYWPTNFKNLLLKSDSRTFWEPMKLNPEGLGTPMDVPDILRSYYIDVYGGFPKYLEKQFGYTQGEDLFLFPYDWRMDNGFHTRYPLHNIGSLVDEALDKSYNRRWGTTRKATDDVIIIAHSMGGIVTRYYLLNPDNAKKVDTVIMLGTPNHGSPKAFRALGTTGYAFDAPWLDNEVAKEVGANWPSAYQLLPFEDFLLDEGGSLQKSSDVLPTYTSHLWEKPASLNMKLLESGRAFQSEIQPFPDSVKLFIIGGWNVATPNGFMKTRETIRKRNTYVQPEWMDYSKTVDLNSIMTGDATYYLFNVTDYVELYSDCGDGTVPLDSTLLPAARMFYSNGVAHMDLVKEDDSRDKVKSLLDGVIPKDTQKPCSSAPKPGHQEVIQYTAISPADLHVYDSQGRHAGKTKDGPAENGIPGGFFEENFGTQTFTVPYAETPLRVELKGTGDNILDFKVVESHNDVVREISFNNMGEKNGSVFTFNHEPGYLGEESALSVDENGDGRAEEQRTPDDYAEYDISSGEEESPCCCLPMLPAAMALAISLLLGLPYALNKK